ncbi:MFS transporter, partial [Myxococcota bacterium]|nr:MFS transporter [Myxococcota bacterium]
MSEAATKKDNFIIQYFKDFSVLKETKREYWGLQAINAFDSLAYFAMFNIVVVMLSEDYNFSDTTAGYAFTVFSTLTTIFLFLSGLVSDWLGIKKSIFLALFGLAATRLAVAGAAMMPDSILRDAVVVGGLALMAPFMAMLQTVFQAANKRFTTKRSRGAGFNLWYLFMNVGAMGGGLIVDYFYLDLGLPRYYIMWFGAASAGLSIIVTLLTIHRTEQLYGPGETPEEAPESDAPRKSPWRIAGDVLSESVFWRFTALITLLLGVRAVFLYLSLLHPKFWLRVIGPEAKIGALQAFNPFMVIIGLIILIPILQRFNVYKMLVTGAFITSLSMFITAIPNSLAMDQLTISIYNAMPGFIQNFATSFVGVPLSASTAIVYFTYLTSFLFLVVLTLGELIWSPRLQEFTAA